MGIEDLIQQSAMIVTMGKGGVGKTTVSAAIGIKAATMGSKVLVLTIDPANRLADAFGVNTTMAQPTLPTYLPTMPKTLAKILTKPLLSVEPTRVTADLKQLMSGLKRNGY